MTSMLDAILAGGVGVGGLTALAWGAFWKIKKRLGQEVRDNTLQSDFTALHERYDHLQNDVTAMQKSIDELKAFNSHLVIQQQINVASMKHIAEYARLIQSLIQPILESPEKEITNQLLVSLLAQTEIISSLNN